jgi:hypothetical protein
MPISDIQQERYYLRNTYILHAAKIMSIMSTHGTTAYAHPEKGSFGQITVLSGQNAFETSGAPLVHSNSTLPIRM